ncbi:MAG: lipid-transfer protein [Nevskiaceae bacterium]|nr:MAG: lipid-transfer protein [Burkholderiaceae bacterium]TBR73794.1 MAG: lipid-transfer protein [Nevskiaceae bacterium]
MNNAVYVSGVGMIPFAKPGHSEHYPEMAKRAIVAALDDAGVSYGQIQQAYAGYVYGDSGCGHRVVYGVGLTGIPVFNVNSNCSSGSSALFLARQAVQSGVADCVLAVGFEEMQPGALTVHYPDRPDPLERFNEETLRLSGHEEIPFALRYFGGAGKAHMDRYGTKLSTFAKIRVKASRHAARNPKAVFRGLVTEEQVLESKAFWPGYLTRLMCCPPTCGAAAAVLCSEKFAKQHRLNQRVRIRAQAMTSDTARTFESGDMREVVGYGIAQEAARQVYEAAGIGPEDVDVVELHDCFCQNELITYESLGLCPEGGAEKFVLDGDNTYGGKVVTNPSGGLLCKGHPLGATGLAQCAELVEQLRGEAGTRQVDGARLGLQHNLGLGSACVVTLYERVG